MKLYHSRAYYVKEISVGKPGGKPGPILLKNPDRDGKNVNNVDKMTKKPLNISSLLIIEMENNICYSFRNPKREPE